MSIIKKWKLYQLHMTINGLPECKYFDINFGILLIALLGSPQSINGVLGFFGNILAFLWQIGVFISNTNQHAEQCKLYAILQFSL